MNNGLNNNDLKVLRSLRVQLLQALEQTGFLNRKPEVVKNFEAMDFGEGMQSYYDSEDSDDDRSQVRNPRFLRVED